MNMRAHSAIVAPPKPGEDLELLVVVDPRDAAREYSQNCPVVQNCPVAKALLRAAPWAGEVFVLPSLLALCYGDARWEGMTPRVLAHFIREYDDWRIEGGFSVTCPEPTVVTLFAQ